MKYINKKMVIVLNQMVCSMTGGTVLQGNNIRERCSLGFVEQIFHNTVFGQPIYPDIFHQAGAYMFYIIKNHIFIDGNKRTGLAAAITFLKWNNIMFAPFEEEQVFDFVVEVSSGVNDPEIMIPKIASWLKNMSLY